MNDIPVSRPTVSQKRHIAPIWVLPFIALLVGVWLVWRSLLDMGPEITIEFESAEGIVPNQTQVQYKGMVLGVVKSTRGKDDLSGVIVTVQIDKRIYNRFEGIPKETEFWLVQPQVTLGGITGLNTLLSGNYIGVQLPGKKMSGEYAEHFVALDTPPPLPMYVPGLHITFKTDRLGSVGVGTQISYRQIKVGTVQSAAMAEDGSGVVIGVHILPEYAHLVRKNTRFWNASGVRLEAGLGGIKLETDSLASLMVGGVSMGEPDTSAPASENSDAFYLYEDFEAAETSVFVNVRFPSADGLTKGITKVLYKNIAVGKLRDVWYDKTQDAVYGRFGIDPRFESFITDKTRFWLVKPELSAAGITGLDALVSGSYLAFAASDQGNPVHDHNFVAANGPDPLDYSAPGLHLKLTSPTAAVPIGAPVYFNDFVVGTVENRLLEKNGIATHILIRPEYRHLVNDSSRFWNVSGLRVDASLRKGIQMQSAPLTALIAGGIAFDSPAIKGKKELHDGDVFALQASESIAKTVASRGLPGTYLTLEAPEAGGIQVGAPVLHKDLQVGSVQELSYSDNGKLVQILVNIEEGHSQLLDASTRFWRSGAVDIKVGGGGVNMRVGSLAQMVDGGIAFDSFADKNQQAGKTAVRRGDRFLLFSSKDEASNAGVTVRLLLANAEALSTGSEIRYRGLPLGEITRLQLSEDLKSVNAEAALKNDALPLLNSGSRFWKVTPALGLARTAHLDTLLGSYLELRPGKGNPVREFTVTEQEPVVTARDTGLNVLLTTPQLGSLKTGDPVLYRQVKVGEVLGSELSADGKAVQVYINIWPQHVQLVRDNSHFWNASGIQVEAGLFSGVDINTESVESILSGGVAFSTPDNAGDPAKEGQHFKLADNP